MLCGGSRIAGVVAFVVHATKKVLNAVLVFWMLRAKQGDN